MSLKHPIRITPSRAPLFWPMARVHQIRGQGGFSLLPPPSSEPSRGFPLRGETRGPLSHVESSTGSTELKPRGSTDIFGSGFSLTDAKYANHSTLVLVWTRLEGNIIFVVQTCPFSRQPLEESGE